MTNSPIFRSNPRKYWSNTLPDFPVSNVRGLQNTKQLRYDIVLIGLLFATAIIFPFVYLYILVLFYVSNSYVRAHSKTLILFLLLILSVIISSRVWVNEIFPDTFKYIQAYKQFENASFAEVTLVAQSMYSSGTDILFWYPSYFLNLIFPQNGFMFLWFWAFFTLALIASGYKKILPIYWMIAFIFFCSSKPFYEYPGQLMRQSAAMGWFIIALASAYHGKLNWAIIFSVIAGLTHPTGWLMLPFFLIQRFWQGVSRNVYWVMLLVTFVIGQTTDVMNIIQDFLKGTGNLGHKTAYYSDTQHVHYLINITFIRLLVILTIVVWVEKFLKRSFDKPFELILHCYIYSGSLGLLFFQNSVTYIRLSSFRLLVEGLIIAVLISKIGNKKLFIPIFMVFLMVYNLFWLDVRYIHFLDGNGINTIGMNITDFINIVITKFSLSD